MNILVACERSGVVREAFRKRGHNAWSCDLVPAEDGSEHHIQANVLDVLTGLGWYPWDLMIAFPDCTYLCNSGALRLYKGGKKVNGEDPERWGLMRVAAHFFKTLLQADIPSIAVENPVMHKYAQEIIGQRYTQTIQPYNFGEDASKRTCLWLKGLPELEVTKIVAPHYGCGPCGIRQKVDPVTLLGNDFCFKCGGPVKKIWSNQTPGGWNKLGPSPTRGIDRARTYAGIAEAMAAQWGNLHQAQTI